MLLKSILFSSIFKSDLYIFYQNKKSVFLPTKGNHLLADLRVGDEDSTHICILYSPGPVLAVLAHRMGIWSNPLKNGFIQHILVFSGKFTVIPEV